MTLKPTAGAETLSPCASSTVCSFFKPLSRTEHNSEIAHLIYCINELKYPVFQEGEHLITYYVNIPQTISTISLYLLKNLTFCINWHRKLPIFPCIRFVKQLRGTPYSADEYNMYEQYVMDKNEHENNEKHTVCTYYVHTQVSVWNLCKILGGQQGPNFQKWGGPDKKWGTLALPTYEEGREFGGPVEICTNLIIYHKIFVK